MATGDIYIGTILLEVNRWSKEGKRPSFKVSEWTSRFSEAGFAGMELWQYHATRCAAGELAALAECGFPAAVFNIYPTMNDEDREERAACDGLLGRLGAGAVKFNVGARPELRGEYLANMRAWREQTPPEVRLLCECHPGTLIEEPAEARRFFDELGPEGWEVIVHPFSRFESLEEWLELFGPAVSHAHLQMRGEEKGILRFDRRPELAGKAIGLMRERGFAGTYALEFTEGTGRTGENIETLFENALRDLAFLKRLLA